MPNFITRELRQKSLLHRAPNGPRFPLVGLMITVLPRISQLWAVRVENDWLANIANWMVPICSNWGLTRRIYDIS